MGLHAHAQEFDALERRSSTRSRVNCPVQLQLPSGRRSGSLVDLSERGARVELDNPPGVGASVLLEWMCYDAVCKVIWATENACGLMFEKPVSLARVIEAQQYREEFDGPVAECVEHPARAQAWPDRRLTRSSPLRAGRSGEAALRREQLCGGAGRTTGCLGPRLTARPANSDRGKH
jgi:hypothetical protein